MRLSVPVLLGFVLSLGCGAPFSSDSEGGTHLDVWFDGTSCDDEGRLEVVAATDGDVASVTLTLYNGPDQIDWWPMSARGSGWIVAIEPEAAGLTECSEFAGLYGILKATGADGTEVTSEGDIYPR